MLERALTAVTWLLAFAVGCGPDDKPRDSCRQKPTFAVTIRLAEGSFPDDTSVSFEYGGGKESFELRTAPSPQVVFCEAQRAPSPETGSGGEGGASTEAPITAIVCELWTGGSTDVAVTASGYQPIVDFQLKADRELCTVTETITLVPELD